MEMLERVARAIKDTRIATQRGGPNRLTSTDKAAARAAIEAMREPTETILEAYWRTRSEGDLENWQAMIDAALAPRS